MGSLNWCMGSPIGGGWRGAAHRQEETTTRTRKTRTTRTTRTTPRPTSSCSSEDHDESNSTWSQQKLLLRFRSTPCIYICFVKVCTCVSKRKVALLYFRSAAPICMELTGRSWVGAQVKPSKRKSVSASMFRSLVCTCAFFLLLVLISPQRCWCMLKRPYQPDEDEDSPNKLLRNIQDLISGNDISAARGRTLLKDLSKIRPGARKFVSKWSKNSTQKFARRMLKMSKWPPIYEATVRTWCPKKNEEVRSKIHVLLPHEIVEALCENGDIDKMHEVLCDPQTFEHLEKQKRAHGLTRAIPLGFWMDGIPYNSNREESLDVLTMNLPGLDGAFAQLRIPLAAMDHSMVSENTWDDILEIMVWSLQQAACGETETSRHDKAPWDKVTDKSRRASKKLAARSFLCEARIPYKHAPPPHFLIWQLTNFTSVIGSFSYASWVLPQGKAHHAYEHLKMKFKGFTKRVHAYIYIMRACQVRGDWDMYKKIFRFPQHNEQAGCCWRCKVTPMTIRDVGATANWRSERLTSWECMARMLHAGLTICSLWSAPGFSTDICKLDWLHVMDQGVAADFLGQFFFWMLDHHYVGPNRKVRCWNPLFLFVFAIFKFQFPNWYREKRKRHHKTRNLAQPEIGIAHSG